MSRPLPRPRWTPRVLDGVSAMLAVVALAALAWRGTPTVKPRAVVLPTGTAGEVATTTDIDSVADQIVATNLFSATRRTPRERFVAPGQSVAEAPGIPDAYAPPGVVGPSADELRVVGIVSVNGVRRALVDASTQDSTTRLVDVGDRIAGYRVRRIGADVVEFSSSSGTRIVRLSRRSSPDSSESLP